MCNAEAEYDERMPLRIGLAHTKLKIGRAYLHFEELKRVEAEYREHAYSITRHDDKSNGIHRVAIEQAVTPDKLGALPGEFAYCLRSALDHLAWQLALLTTDSPNAKTCFPIYESIPVKNSRYWDSISDIPVPASTVIQELQPFNRGTSFKDDLLWQLNKLCNIDKHQVIAVGCTLFQIRIDGVTKARRKDFNHAIEIAVPLAEKEQLRLDVSIPGVKFGEPIDATDGSSPFEIGIERFGEIFNYVRYKLIPRFENFSRRCIFSLQVYGNAARLSRQFSSERPQPATPPLPVARRAGCRNASAIVAA